MYILHYAPDNASMIVRLVLEAHTLPYRTELVDRRRNQQQSPAYLALNPMGLIPTLVTPLGPISETAAILLWLADRHGLAPDVTHPKRPALLQWLAFLSNTAHAELRQIFYPDRYVPQAALVGHHQIMTARMGQHFGLLNRATAEQADLFAPAGILAPYVCALLRWAVLYPRGQEPWFSLGQFPDLQRLALALQDTPQAQSVALAEGLGPQPFTAPAYPTPSEGSAT